MKRVQTIKAQSAYPYSMDIPNWNTGQVAIGLGDNSIKLWSFSNKNLIMNSKDPNEYYSAVVFWKGLQGKIGKVMNEKHRHILTA